MTHPTKPAALKQYARLTEKRKALFLDALEKGWTVTKACRVSSLSPHVVYQWRLNDPEFAKQWDDALEAGTDVLEDALMERAAKGVTRYRFHQGRVIMVPCKRNDEGAVKVGKDDNGKPVYMRPYTEQEYSDTLGIFLLKGRRPKYRDSFKAEISGPDGGPLVLQAIAELEANPPQVIEGSVVRRLAMEENDDDE